MKDGFLRVAAAAPHIRVADCVYNAANIIEDIGKAAEQKIKLLVFPELAITGYTIGDLIFQDSLYDASLKALGNIREATKGVDMLVLVGFYLREGGKTYNSAAVLNDGRIIGVVPKTNVPNYGEFYEQRVFEPAPVQNRIIELLGESCVFGTKMLFCCENMSELIVAAEICEDVWVADAPSISHTSAGATVIANLSASNDYVTKDEFRRSMVVTQSSNERTVYIYTSSGEGESSGDTVFSAHRLIAQNGQLLAECEPFSDERFAVCECDLKSLLFSRYRAVSVSATDDRGYTRIPFSLKNELTQLSTPMEPMVFVPSDPQELAKRCEMILNIQYRGLRKRMEHINAKKLLLGVSGGLDSTLALIVCCLALDSMKRDRTDLIAITMPCFGTTARTRGNAEKLCEALGVDFRTVDISDTVRSHFADIGLTEQDRSVAYENAQARERTQVLFDIANACGGMVVGTGDMSEIALGFATYNGDHMSSYCVNCTVPKTLIPSLLQHACEKKEFAAVAATVADVIATPVSPELLPVEGGVQKQLTQDTTGPYELADFFLYHFVRKGVSASKMARIAKHAFGDKYTDEQIVYWLKVFIRRFFNNQFKRSCVPDGPKVGSVSLSPRADWRMPSDAVYSVWSEELK